LRQRRSLLWANRAPKIETAITDTPRNRLRHTQILERVGANLRGEESGTGIQVVPFVRGRRPTDDARHPGLGSSDHAALVLGGEDVINRAYVLYTLPERHDGMTVDATLSLTGHDGTATPVEVPGWHHRPVELQCFDASGDGSLRAAQPGDKRFVLTLDPETDLFPGKAWTWDELTESARRCASSSGDRQSPRQRRRSTSPTSGASARCTTASSSGS